MSLETQVMEQLKLAMKNKEQATMRTLRAIKAAILEAKTAANAKATFDSADELKLIQKMVKQRKDSLDIYKQQNREDLAATEQEELNVLETFLPKQMDEAELTAALKAIVEKTEASSPKDMGKVMGIASKELAGKVDGSMIAKIVKDLLTGN